jgi:hypothetical protein
MVENIDCHSPGTILDLAGLVALLLSSIMLGACIGQTIVSFLFSPCLFYCFKSILMSLVKWYILYQVLTSKFSLQKLAVQTNGHGKTVLRVSLIVLR